MNNNGVLRLFVLMISALLSDVSAGKIERTIMNVNSRFEQGYFRANSTGSVAKMNTNSDFLSGAYWYAWENGSWVLSSTMAINHDSLGRLLKVISMPVDSGAPISVQTMEYDTLGITVKERIQHTSRKDPVIKIDFNIRHYFPGYGDLTNVNSLFVRNGSHYESEFLDSTKMIAIDSIINPEENYADGDTGNVQVSRHLPADGNGRQMTITQKTIYGEDGGKTFEIDTTIRIRIYNRNGQIDTLKVTSLSDAGRRDTSFSIRSYDENGFLVEEKTEFIVDGLKRMSSRDLYFRNSTGRVDSIINQPWNDSEWINGTRISPCYGNNSLKPHKVHPADFHQNEITCRLKRDKLLLTIPCSERLERVVIYDLKGKKIKEFCSFQSFGTVYSMKYPFNGMNLIRVLTEKGKYVFGITSLQ